MRLSGKGVSPNLPLEWPEAASFDAGGLDITRKYFHVFIATAGKIQNYYCVLFHLRRAMNQLCEGVRGFKRGNNSFDACQRASGCHRILIAGGGVFRTALISEPSMLGADGRIVQAGRD